MDVCTILCLYYFGEEGDRYASFQDCLLKLLRGYDVTSSLCFDVALNTEKSLLYFSGKKSIMSVLTNNLHCVWRIFFNEANDG